VLRSKTRVQLCLTLLTILVCTAVANADSGGFRSLTVNKPEIPVESPFTVDMAASSNITTFVSCIVYLDDTKFGQVNGGVMKMLVSAPVGRHKITVQCYDRSNVWTKQTFFVQVVSLGSSNHYVDLFWNASKSSNVVGYFVYRGTSSGGPFARVNSRSTTSTWFTDANVQSGRTYFYVTTAVDTYGRESSFSNTAGAKIPSP
jgi:hypothetical protein